jgi:hypothetical protein
MKNKPKKTAMQKHLQVILEQHKKNAVPHTWVPEYRCLVCAKTEREYNAEVVEQGLKNKE